MNRRNTFFLFLFFCFPSQGMAQEIDYGGWEIGIDVLGLFGRGTEMPSFFVKRTKLKQKENDFGFIRRGFRIRFGAQFSFPNEQFGSSIGAANPQISLNNQTKRFVTTFSRVGYEWRKKIGLIDLIYGADFHVGYRQLDYSYVAALNSISGASAMPGIVDFKSRYFSSGISPVFGLAYPLSSRVAICTESVANIFFTRSLEKYSWGDSNYASKTGAGFTITLVPVFVANIQIRI